MNKFIYNENPDKNYLAEVTEAIRLNHNYCCCATEKTPDTMCMCKEFREENSAGFCHCERFYKVQKFEIVSLVFYDLSDEEALHFVETWRERIEKLGFIALMIELKEPDLFGYNQKLEMDKAKIEKSDLVLIIDKYIPKDNHNFIELSEWAEKLHKPFTSLEVLLNRRTSDEDNKSESV